MTDLPLQFVVAASAIFLAVYIVKAVLPLLGRSTKGSTGAGEQDVQFWRQANREIIRDALDSSVIPILAQQTRILEELKALSQQEEIAHLRLQLTADQLLNRQEEIRESLHRTDGRLQEVIGRLPS